MKSKINHILFIALASILLSACTKEEVPLTLPPTKGNVKGYTLNLGKDYTTQLYFTLGSGNIKGNDFTAWDIAFDCNPSSRFIILNGGKEVQICRTDCKEFTDTFNLQNAEWNWDNPGGPWLGTGIGNWFDSLNQKSFGHTYVVDRGQMETNRYKKLKISAIEQDRYLIHCADIDGSNFIATEVRKMPGRNYVYFNFDQPNTTLDLEPDRNEWDLLFTRYKHVYYDMIPITPYSVTGVLLNPNKVVCYKDSVQGFDNIDVQFAMTVPMSKQKDIIGFDWKRYDFTLARYDVVRKYTYIIKDTKGSFYKLRFIDFYDEQGLKGAPKFEIQRL